MVSSDQDWPRCACGCNEAVPARKANCKARGFTKGEPCIYVAGHRSTARLKLVKNGQLECSKCRLMKSTKAFNRHATRPSGYCSWCRECDSQKSAAWYQRNRERVWATMAAYNAKHPGKNRRGSSAYRARRLAAFVEDVDPLIVFERDNGICGICFQAVEPEDFHVDHVIPLTRGGEHSYLNVQIAHPSCNRRKGNRIENKE